MRGIYVYCGYISKWSTVHQSIISILKEPLLSLFNRRRDTTQKNQNRRSRPCIRILSYSYHIYYSFHVCQRRVLYISFHFRFFNGPHTCFERTYIIFNTGIVIMVRSSRNKSLRTYVLVYLVDPIGGASEVADNYTNHN